MANVIETCRECGSRDLAWERDAGWVTGSWRCLRCMSCGASVRATFPLWTLVLYFIAAVTAIWGWVTLSAR